MRSGRGAAIALRIATGVLFLFYLVPAAIVFINSFKSNTEIVTAPAAVVFTPTLDGYRDVVNPSLFQAFGNSAIIALGSAVVTILLATPLAYGLSRIPVKWTGVIIGVLIALQMTPTSTSIIPLFRIMAELKLLNNLIGVIFAVTATAVPFVALILRPFFLSIPQDVFEAAHVDGASAMRVFTAVAVPLSRNGILLIGILTFIAGWGDLIYSVSFLNNGSLYPFSVLIAQQTTLYGTQWNSLMALGMVGAVPTIILFAFVSKRLSTGLTLGASK